MEKSNAICIPKERRIHNLREVSLGFSKKIAQDEARRCPQCKEASCIPSCPLGIDIPGFIRFLREADSAEALERIRRDNPFPEICGRLCPAPCEESCVFYADGETLSIRLLERYAADEGSLKEKETQPPTGAKKVAVIGAGVSGLSAAYYLARSNFHVSVFEATHEPGGLLRFCVPEFRLPNAVLKKTIARLKSLGVEIHIDAILGRTIMADEIFMQGFSAILLATGSTQPVFSDLPGHHWGHVYYDVEFLTWLQTINKEEALWQSGKKRAFAAKAVVLGKGHAAFDAARFALRLGSQVDLVCEGLEEELGVGKEILEQSLEEGLRIHTMKPIEIIGDDKGFAAGVKCHRLNMVEGNKNITLEVSKEEAVVFEAQCVIIANGHRPATDIIRQSMPQLKFKDDGAWLIDEQTGMTTMDKVFACIKKSDPSILNAISSGKSAAQKIAAYFHENH